MTEPLKFDDASLIAAINDKNALELRKLQFDYAWKWFAFHADQRVKMFNYMLVVFGIFAVGIANALDKSKGVPPIVAAGLCFVAAILAVIFARLDARNRDLVWFGEDVLMHLERDSLFGTDNQISGRRNKTIRFGILSRQAWEQESESWGSKYFQQFENKSNCLAKGAGRLLRWLSDLLYDTWHGKHRIWLPLISLLIGALFVAAGILILCKISPPIPSLDVHVAA